MADELILGVWTEEEFKDTLIFAAAVAVVSFITTICYRFLSKKLGMR